MDLVCEKYRGKAEKCRHPREYCKFRSACLLHFPGGGTGRDDDGHEPEPHQPGASSEEIGKESMDTLRFDKGEGLLPAIVQDWRTNEVLMVAYINEEAWRRTLETGKAHYWSRSRGELWLKGASSGHFQLVREILVDCDADTVIYRIEQQGAACHKGYRSCFFRRVEAGTFAIKDKPVFDPEEVYGK